MDSQSLQATEDFSASRAQAPRVSLEDMKSRIVAEHYINAGAACAALGQPTDVGDPLDLMTVCFLRLDNGFVVLGKSAPASRANYDEHKGKTFAYEDAIKQLWPLMGFALRDHLSFGGQSWWAQPAS